MGVTTTENRFWSLLVIFFAHFSFGKTAIPPSILARTQNPSVTIKIFRKLKYYLSFVDLGPKLTVLALLSRYSQKMAIIQEEPWKFGKLPVPRKWKKKRSGSNGKIVALDVLVICVVDKNRSPKKYFLPQVSKFLGSKFDIFGFGTPAGKCFHERGVLLVPWYGDSKSCSSSPRKLGYLAPFSLDCMI